MSLSRPNGAENPRRLRFCSSHSLGMQNQISKEHSRSAGKPQPPEMINPANRNGRAEPRPSSSAHLASCSSRSQLELATIEFYAAWLGWPLPPLWLKRGWSTRPQNEFVNECLRCNSRPGNLSPRLYQPDSMPYRNEIRCFRSRKSYDLRLR